MRRSVLFAIGIIIFSFLSCDDGLNDIYNNGDVKKIEDSGPEWGDYSAGDKGPSGGLIFYANENYEADGWMYLEAAPADEAESPWGTAVYLCNTKSTGGSDDWFLPSCDELKLIYNILYGSVTAAILPKPYWSSTENEIDTSQAYSIEMHNSGNSVVGNKGDIKNVRAVRKF